MSNVICIKTRTEINELPLNAISGQAIILQLLAFKENSGQSISDDESKMIIALVRMVENNSGIKFFDVAMEAGAK